MHSCIRLDTIGPCHSILCQILFTCFPDTHECHLDRPEATPHPSNWTPPTGQAMKHRFWVPWSLQSQSYLSEVCRKTSSYLLSCFMSTSSNLFHRNPRIYASSKTCAITNFPLLYRTAPFIPFGCQMKTLFDAISSKRSRTLKTYAAPPL